jgi:hypothetical protein
MLDANPMYETRDIKMQSGVQVIAAEDGMTLDPASYSAEMRQKTLNLFKEGTEGRSQ